MPLSHPGWSLGVKPLPVRPNRPLVVPVKHKRYPATVTVCIAAVCRNANEDCIVLCSDNRLDLGDMGSTNIACKMDVLGRNWCVQVAGEWSGVLHLASILKGKTQARSWPGAMETSAHAAVDDFLKSPLCQPDADYQLLVSGFTERGIPAL